MVQRDRHEEESPGLTEMVLDAEPEGERPKAQPQDHRKPPEDENELPLAGQ
ncbi:hypothetical protein [Sphingomonas alba]|uniref:GAGE domain-containing protein n=1 Tax=Sphingomonas alba TaxID=2908208 RepID=A0ABT0RL85_9SPHN|nr:hypothetical protein [Sphingomonas alba]MCL6683396.1 hypothetical protein [Sphingomonas alba]